MYQISAHATEPHALGGQTYPRRAQAHKFASAFFATALALISSVFIVCSNVPQLTEQIARMRKHVGCLTFPHFPTLVTGEDGRPCLRAQHEAVRFACDRIHRLSSLVTMGARTRERVAQVCLRTLTLTLTSTLALRTLTLTLTSTLTLTLTPTPTP